jgi:uncharacterized protein (DUF952 family)
MEDKARCMIIHHITSKKDWEAAQKSGSYRGDTLDSQGFIHCSSDRQVAGVANRIFRDRKDLVVLGIDTERVKPEIKWENLEGGSDLFPHIYGALNLDAVVEVRAFTAGEDGVFRFP